MITVAVFLHLGLNKIDLRLLSVALSHSELAGQLLIKRGYRTNAFAVRRWPVAPSATICYGIDSPPQYRRFAARHIAPIATEFDAGWAQNGAQRLRGRGTNGKLIGIVSSPLRYRTTGTSPFSKNYLRSCIF